MEIYKMRREKRKITKISLGHQKKSYKKILRRLLIISKKDNKDVQHFGAGWCSGLSCLECICNNDSVDGRCWLSNQMFVYESFVGVFGMQVAMELIINSFKDRYKDVLNKE